MKKIWAIILAAGESKRMGANKLLLPYKKNYIINYVINYINKSQINHSLLVLGAFREDILKAIEGEQIDVCYNRNYQNGMLSSVQCGIRALPENTDAVMIFLGDQPTNNESVINTLIEEYHSCPKGIVVPVYEGKRGHPLLIDSKYFIEIFNLNPDIGLRELLQKHKDDIRLVKVNEAGILRDIDTPEDYRRLIGELP